MKRIHVAILLVMLALCLGAAALAETQTVTVTGTYGQSDARGMLEMINAFRASEDAWYWNSDDTTRTELDNLQPLAYDCELEKVAMQRAIEIAMYFSHTRPNGSGCFSAYSLASIGYSSKGENIAAGYGTAEGAFIGWREDDEMYIGQGHRRNMLDDGFNRVGIGHVKFNGRHFWVQEFGYASAAAGSAAAADGDRDVDVQIELSEVTSVALANADSSLQVAYDEGLVLPGGVMVQLSETWPARPFRLDLVPAWNSADATVVSVAGATLTGMKVGETELSATVLGVALSLPVKVVPADLSDARITVSGSGFVYNAAPHTPGIEVKLGGKALVRDVDFTAAYSKNVNAGTASVAVTGMGNYTGRASAGFDISPAPMDSVALAPVAAATYTGAAIEPEPALTFGGVALNRDADYTVAYSANTGAGTATLTVTGAGNFTGTRSAAFEINPAPLTAATLDAIPEATYTGAEIKPALSLSYNGAALAEGRDYEAACADNVNVGTATIRLAGKGNFTGETSAQFTIGPAPLSTAQLAEIPARIYTGEAFSPEISVSFNGRALAKDADYTVSTWADNVNAGTATATFTGAGNFTGTATASFTILPADLAAATFGDIDRQTYTGAAITPEPTLTLGGAALRKDIDYRLSWTDNIAAGTATVAAEGIGNYAGTASARFEIGPADLSGVQLADIPAQSYTGSPVIPAVAVSFNGVALSPGVDYTVEVSDAVGPGTARATLSGIGNFTGLRECAFEIVAPPANPGEQPANPGEQPAEPGPVAEPVPVEEPEPFIGTYSDGEASYDISADGTATYLKPAKSAKTVTIPDAIAVGGRTVDIVKVADKAFNKDKKLTTVKIGKHVKTIGKSAFAGCARLKTVKGGAGLTTIGDNAFKGCKALAAFTLGKNVKKIGKGAFNGCSGLKKITVKTGKLTEKSVGKDAFKGINAKAAFKCPKKKLKAYKSLFKKKGAPKKARYDKG